MTKMLEKRVACVTLSILFALAIVANSLAGGAVPTFGTNPVFPPDAEHQTADGVVFPPDPWERADGVVFPPDPWERADGVVFPPDPWERADGVVFLPE